MRFILGWLILMPFVGVWYLTLKIVNACVRKSDALRLFGVVISVLVGAGSVVAGYLIGPIVGWFIMAVGGIIGIGFAWRSLVATKESVELEEMTDQITREQEEIEIELVKEKAAEMLEEAEVDDAARVDWFYTRLDRIKFKDEEAFNLWRKLKELKEKRVKA